MVTTCIPFATGVPAVEGPNLAGPPNWTGTVQPTPSPTVIQELDDPRWRGSVRQAFPLLGSTGGVGSGAGEQAALRALYYTDGGRTNVYLSWLMELDVPAVESNDALYVGFSPVPNPQNQNPAAIAAIIQLDTEVAGQDEHEREVNNPVFTIS